MKRECLLSRAYTGAPMTFNGTEIHYSPMCNELMREFKTAIFHGADDQTDHNAFSECIMVMDALARNDLQGIEKMRDMERSERHRLATTFALNNEEEVERLKPVILERIDRARAAAVESEAGGKPVSQAQESSQP